jgi:hypothetical protein
MGGLSVRCAGACRHVALEFFLRLITIPTTTFCCAAISLLAVT